MLVAVRCRGRLSRGVLIMKFPACPAWPFITEILIVLGTMFPATAYQWYTMDNDGMDKPITQEQFAESMRRNAPGLRMLMSGPHKLRIDNPMLRKVIFEED